MERVVIDTNVLVAALKSRQGASFKLLMALSDKAYVPCISAPLFVEYEAVLKRPGLIPHIDGADMDAVLDYFLSQSAICQIFFLWRPFLKDPKDDLVLEAAVAAQCRTIVTFNLRDFEGTDAAFGITAITPQTFLREAGLI